MNQESGKPRVFMPYVGGVGPFQKRCDAVAERGYQELSFTRSPRALRAG